MVHKKALQVLSVCFLMFISPGLLADTWYVDGSIPRAGDGTSWEKAVKKIQAGINKAADGDTVIVARGTYVENINFNGANIVLRSTNPTDLTVVRQTIIDGNKSGSVVTFTGTEHETCVLCGFTIRNGTGTYIADPTYPGFYGGGILGLWLNLPGRTRAGIQNNIIIGNSAVTGGGGVNECDGAIRNNIIIGNSSPYGGGIAFCDGAIENNLIVGNSAATSGGGISFSNADFRNNVVVGNSAPGSYGGGLGDLGTSPFGPPGGSITNCIIWGNTSPLGPQLYESLRPTYSLIQNWTEGGSGNIALNPAFVDPDGPDSDPATYEDNDYRLLPASACIDAGTNEDWMNGATDLDGNPRILLGATSLTVDMGAYEYHFDFAIGRNIESDVELSWTMLPMTGYTVLSSFDVTAQPWSEETTIFGGRTGGPAVWVDPGASSALKFYKIGIE